MRPAGSRVAYPLRSRRMMGVLVPSGASLCLCVGQLPCHMGLDQSLFGCRFLRVDSRTYLVSGVDLLAGNLAPPQPNGLSHHWFGKILGG